MSADAPFPPPFIVGNTYVDRDGPYEVLAVVDGRLRIRRPGGRLSTEDVALKARIHRNIVFERPENRSLRNRLISFAGGKPAGFTHAEVFPVIAEAITLHSDASGSYLTHDLIVSALLAHPELRPLLDQVAKLDPEQKTITWWASNMLQQFSQVITNGNSEWDRLFERKKIGGSWAYRPRHS